MGVQSRPADADVVEARLALSLLASLLVAASISSTFVAGANIFIGNQYDGDDCMGHETDLWYDVDKSQALTDLPLLDRLTLTLSLSSELCRRSVLCWLVYIFQVGRRSQSHHGSSRLRRQDKEFVTQE